MIDNISEIIQLELDKDESQFKYSVFSLDQAEDIYNLYKSYDGCAEFLYIPSLQEIKQHIYKGKGCYFGAQTADGKIVSVCKLDQLEIPSPFFVPPRYETNDDDNVFMGLSGLLVAKDFRKKGIAKTTVLKALNALSKTGAAGVYGDCDYRNIPSFSTLSSVFNFIGYTDGRKGADGEKTIYTTFYISFGDKEKKEASTITLDVSNAKDLDEVCDVLNAQMSNMGSSTTMQVPYGDEYNELHVFDERIQTPNITLVLEKAKPVFLCKHYAVPQMEAIKEDEKKIERE